MANMQWVRRGFGMLFLAAVVAGSTLGSAQEPTETQPAAQTPTPADASAPVQPAPDPDLTAQVQQLRSEVDQLQQQVSRLSSVVEQLQGARSEPETVVAPARSGKKTPPAAAKKTTVSIAPARTVTPETEEKTPLTVLVFQDGHRVEARNYAIVGQTLWIYTEQDSKKVPLADLDVNATKSANSDRGIVFQVPQTR
jgi:TolA-binding protein